MNIAWITDPHLEFLPPHEVTIYLDEFRATKPDAFLITGDISSSHLLEGHLRLLEDLDSPVYYVTGNHDSYGGSFEKTKKIREVISRECPNVIDLEAGKIIQLTRKTVLVGCRGWGDGRAGAGEFSRVLMNDFEYISDLAACNRDELFQLLNRLGDESAAYMRKILPEAFRLGQEVMIATHVPPFVEASLYQGRRSSSGYLPFFTNVALGNALLEIAQENPKKRLKVYCGHTHAAAVYPPLPNLVVTVGESDYYNPRIHAILKIR